MSANRSVQAAQRRRAGPTSEPGIPGRGPQPSINSAQMFANQARPGSGPNIPTGRLAGQQAAMQQTAMQQQSYQHSQQEQKNDKLSSVSKMTIAQAITLITLRLGAVESKLLHAPDGIQSVSMDGETNMDSGILQSMMSRLESLEKRSSSTSGSVSTPELNLLKQQFESVKNAVIQNKGSTTSLVKENVILKTQIENLKRDLSDTKELLVALQTLTMDNSQKILDMSMGTNLEYNEEPNDLNDTNLDELENSQFTNLEDLQDDSDQNEIIGVDLKQMIESELNTSAM